MFLNHRAVVCQFTALSLAPGTTMKRLNRYLLNRMQKTGISLEAVNPLYKAFSNGETIAALECQRIFEYYTRLKRPEQNE